MTRKRALPALAAGLVVLAGGATLAAELRVAFPPDAEVRALMQRRLDDAGKAGGIVVAFVEPSGTRFLSAGSSGKQARPQVDEHTIFEVGSVTKTFTALLLAEAVKRGEVALDDPLGKTLGDRAGRASSVTLYQLATHTSGLPRIPTTPGFVGAMLLHPRDPYRSFTDGDLDRYLATMEPSKGGAFAYSNVGYGLLGKAVERAAGAPYDTLVSDRITAPLGMRETFVRVPADLADRVAVGHDHNGDVTPSWTHDALAAAGVVRSTAHDLAIYVAAVRDLTPPVSASLFERAADGGRSNRRAALGWVMDGRHGDDLIWHDGGVGGFRSFVGMSRQSKLGVVILTSTERDVTDLGLHLLNAGHRLQGPDDPKWLGIAALLIPVLVIGRALTIGDPPRSRLGKVLAAKRRAPARMDVVGSVLGAAATLALLWHLAPWGVVGGRWVRLAAAIVLGIGAVAALGRAGRLPWFTVAASWRRAGQVVGAVISALVIAVAIHGW